MLHLLGSGVRVLSDLYTNVYVPITRATSPHRFPLWTVDSHLAREPTHITLHATLNSTPLTWMTRVLCRGNARRTLELPRTVPLHEPQAARFQARFPNPNCPTATHRTIRLASVFELPSSPANRAEPLLWTMPSKPPAHHHYSSCSARQAPSPHHPSALSPPPSVTRAPNDPTSAPADAKRCSTFRTAPTTSCSGTHSACPESAASEAQRCS